MALKGLPATDQPVVGLSEAFVRAIVEIVKGWVRIAGCEMKDLSVGARAMSRLGITVSLGCLVAIAFVGAMVCKSASAFSGLTSAQAPTSSGNILVGPNIQVDQQQNTPFAEPAVAAEGNRSARIIGASEFFGRSNWGALTFSSDDGGYSWTASTIPRDTSFLGDVQVGYGNNGLAYFAALGSSPDATHKGLWQYGLYVFESSDNGMSWRRVTFLRSPYYDHEQLLIDETHSKFRGRMYIFTSLNPAQHSQSGRLGILRSSDRGHSWEGPVPVVAGLDFNSNLAIFADGTLLAPYQETEGDPRKLASTSAIKFAIKFATSSDGGLTFSSPHTIAERYFVSRTEIVARQRRGATDWDADSVPRFAIDTTTGPFRGRIYVIWSDMRYGSSRLFFTISTDRGQTWSRPRILAADNPPDGSQYQPCIAVSDSGIIGVSWYDTRINPKEHNKYDEYFTASLDGGSSFLRPVRVSSETSHAAGPGNLAFTPFGSDLSGASLDVYLTAPVGRFPSGGDYMGLTVDGRNIFHPFWIDARSGTYQVFTAPVIVEQALGPAPPTKPTDITSKVSLVFGHGVWDPLGTTLSLPVALKNISNEPLYGPFKLTVTSVRLPARDRYETLVVLNATNSRSGIGATFDYSHVLGDFKTLEPQAVTEPVIWKLKMNQFAIQPTIGVKVSGYTLSAKPRRA